MKTITKYIYRIIVKATYFYFRKQSFMILYMWRMKRWLKQN